MVLTEKISRKSGNPNQPTENKAPRAETPARSKPSSPKAHAERRTLEIEIRLPDEKILGNGPERTSDRAVEIVLHFKDRSSQFSTQSRYAPLKDSPPVLQPKSFLLIDILSQLAGPCNFVLVKPPVIDLSLVLPPLPAFDSASYLRSQEIQHDEQRRDIARSELQRQRLASEILAADIRSSDLRRLELNRELMRFPLVRGEALSVSSPVYQLPIHIEADRYYRKIYATTTEHNNQENAKSRPVLVENNRQKPST